MNGGSISDNKLLYAYTYRYPYGALYVDNATATLNNVTINNNRSDTRDGEGAAIYADNSTVTLNDCQISCANDYFVTIYGNTESCEVLILGENSKMHIQNLSSFVFLSHPAASSLTIRGGQFNTRTVSLYLASGYTVTKEGEMYVVSPLN